MLKVRRHVRFGLSYRDLAELLAGRGIEVDDSTLSRWVQDLTPLLVDCVDETDVKVVPERECGYPWPDPRPQTMSCDGSVVPLNPVTTA